MIVPGSASPLLASAGGYNLTNSLRFRSSASAYLNRTPASAGNRRTFTISYWMKRGILGTTQYLFSAGSGTTESTWFQAGAFDTNGTSFDSTSLGTWTSGGGVTTALFRDPSAWYHFVWAVDTTQATASNRVKLWVNGVQQTLTTPTISQNADLAWNNSGVVHYIGARIDSGPRTFVDGYLTEINSIDGQALTPSSFGETSTSTGVWIPKKYTGTYGTNGFYLPFTDNSALTTSSNVGLGKDFSGNANYWVTNNISLTAGSTYDSMTDVPTLTSATAANYAVMNPLVPNGTITNGNLQVASSTTNGRTTIATIPASTAGSWYCEIIPTGKTAGDYHIGVFGTTTTFNPFNPRLLYVGTGSVFNDSSNVATYATYTTNDVMGITYNASTKTASFYKNNTLQGSITTSSSEDMYFGVCGDSSGTSQNYAFNFGQRPFAYTPPTGFNRLNTFNLPTPTIGATASTTANKYFDVSLYTGTGATQTITNSGSMQPDFVWAKSRANAYNHQLFDSVRGNTQILQSNNTTAEATATTAFSLVSFNSNGYTLGASENSNLSGTSVGWQWRASNATAVTNTAGIITSTVSANTTAGFSIVTWTNNNTANQSVGHGLGVTPSMIITKDRDNGTYNWATWFTGFNKDEYLLLNTTGAKASFNTLWFQTPDSSKFYIGSTGTGVNAGTDKMVAYCFAQVAGYSAFGSYTGNGSSDGTFVYTGFRPRFLLYKNSSSGSAFWRIWDSSRSSYNEVNAALFPNSSNAEDVGGAGPIDFLSNGFKIRTSQTNDNGNGNTFIYMAFAESPFKYANAR